MAATQAAEVIFAQKLASNEKPVRSKALLKLRKYIRVRSERATGGFSEEELLKIWKGLFYCLWMQDQPVQQEELSNKIAGLLFSFRTIDSQFLFFKTFLQTMKREWNGIDRLRMDKFYQLVRFVFSQVFEMLKKQEWESSVVKTFLELFSDQLLQSSSAAPSGLVLHILDLYMAELAAVGAAELTAEQNLSFIEPFCRTMARTKDRVLLKAIGSSIFSTIVDQVPYAIEDLLREIGRGGGELDTAEEDGTSGTPGATQLNGDPEKDSPNPEDMEDKDTSGAVLQFDYGAVADRLFEVASHSNIGSFNRTKIYKIVKIFRDLIEGVFPQNEVEDVSTDEDEYDDGRRRKKKKTVTGKGEKEQDSRRNAKAGVSETDKPEDSKAKNKKKKKRRRKRGVENQQTDENSSITEPDPEQMKKSTLQDTSDAAESTTADGEQPVKRKTGKSQAQSHTTPEKEQKDGVSEAGSGGEAQTQVEQRLKKRKHKPAEAETAVNGHSEQSSVKKRKQKDSPSQPDTNGDAHQEVESVQSDGGQTEMTTGKLKKRKQKPVQTLKKKKKNPAADATVNGHSEKKVKKKVVREAEDPSHPDHKMKKRFVLSQKKAPAPLFCKGLKNKQTPPATKKVTFGLKNNRTMEFRKMDRSSLLSPDRLPFDPSRTPTSGVLKTPSPVVKKRASAADFF